MPDLEIMGAGEGGEGAGHPGPQFALKIRGVGLPPPPQVPPLDLPLANVGGHFCKMKTFPSLFSEAPRTLK